MQKQPNSHHCVVCGVRNDASLKVRFYDTVDDDGQPELLARFTAGSIHQGYPGRLHGGLATGILDETMGRAVNSGKGESEPTTWGVAVELSTRFHQPVPLGTELTARGRIVRHRRRLFDGSGEIYLPDGTVAVTAKGRFVSLSLREISRGVAMQKIRAAHRNHEYGDVDLCKGCSLNRMWSL
ncbi:MAG: PaaI family thioesterase, partial [bacterium]|nr:PaaI family thioesterase [bacterium]